MKRTIATALVAVAALTGAANAMTSDARLAQIQAYAPNADVQSLTNAEIGTLLSVIHSGDTESEKRGFVQAFVN
ncbi:hypothetical protein [Thalassococcus lentus]|uniref:Uncharacterized protein n=1 Tax=Thalassococcus lentus TaxID=1210524 RepID=A0ABT4XMK6_9RHOB|nr:hypothetical protein [Thalassococcus lentus]MDA7423174.1 hypothetical protein [Thalassococcus lentus]